MEEMLMIKSRKKLLLAFVTLLNESDQLNTFTVKRLTTIAKVNRITFYRQFKDTDDFIKWFILKDFIFKYGTSKPINFEFAFIKVYEHIDQNRDQFRKIFTSPYRQMVHDFVHEEIFSYQMSNFARIDVLNTLSQQEIIVHSQFFASGITELIEQYILNPKLSKVSVPQYTSISLRIVKGYIERAIERKQKGEYDTFTPIG
jgi:hypothetical protein